MLGRFCLKPTGHTTEDQHYNSRGKCRKFHPFIHVDPGYVTGQAGIQEKFTQRHCVIIIKI